MGLWKDKKRLDWRYSFQYRGKVYAGGGFQTKADARSAREDRRKKVKSSIIQVTPRGMGFRDVASIYLDDAERRFASKTYQYKAYVFRCFLKEMGNMSINEITPHVLHNYLMTRPTNNNYNAHRKDLCALFTFAKRRLRIIEYNSCWDVDKLPHTPARKTIPTEEQVLRLIAAADPENERPLLMVILLTVARVDEILRLTWQDINFEKRTVTRWTRKRRGGSYEPITTPMNRDLFDILWRIWKNRKQEKWVFFNEDTKSKFNKRPKMMKSICRKAGVVPHFGFHAIRHFIASYMADQQKISKKTISGLLGHKSLQTTEIYLHSIDESQREAMSMIEGKFSSEGVGPENQVDKISRR